MDMQESVERVVSWAARPVRAIACALVVVACACALALTQAGTAHASSINPNYGWYTSSTGSLANPYTITSRYELAGFIELVNGTADVDGDGVADADTFAGKVVQLGANINCVKAKLTPAGGMDGRAFEGIFDGAGYTISSFSIVPAEGQVQNIGLIGAAGEHSIIKNLTVASSASVAIESTGADVVVKNVGLIVGYSEGAVAYCANNGDVSVSSDAEITESTMVRVCNIGGVAGQCLGDVTGCSNTGNVSVAETWDPQGPTSITDVDAVVYVGGVIGCAGDMDKSIDPTSGESHGIITDCSNSGTVMVDTPASVGESTYSTSYVTGRCIGGIAGYSRGSIENCTNSGYIYSEHGQDLGGIVGSLRSAIPTDAYNGGSSESDEGTADTPIHILACENTGTVAAYVSIGGIAGRVGSYGEVIGCVNGYSDQSVTQANQNWIAATRPNKPCPGGIVGVTYGDVSFCVNYGTVASCYWLFDEGKIDSEGTTAADIDRDTVKKNGGLRGGYYASGIAAMLWHYTDDDGNITSPQPTVYSCMNLGAVKAVDNMRSRNIVGDAEEGYVRDNFAITGLCYIDAMTFENALGVNVDLAMSRLMANDALVDTDAGCVTESGEKTAINALYVGKTPVEIMNAHATENSWSVFWNASDGTDYPQLNVFSDEGSNDLSAGVATQIAEAPFTGVAGSVPTLSVNLGGTTLVQDVDFRVVPDATAVEMSSGEAPYTATIVGIGQYSGSLTCAYGIGALDLAQCTVIINSAEFDYAPHAPKASDVTVKNSAGAVVDPDSYTFAFGTASAEWADSAAVDGVPVNAGTYDVVVTAKEGLDTISGSVSGNFSITKESLIYSVDDRKDNPEKFAESAHATTVNAGTAFEAEWQSFRALATNGASTSADTEEIATTFPYTGHVIMPEVTATYKGKTLGVYYAVTGAYFHTFCGDFAEGDYSNQLKAIIGGSELDGSGVAYDNIGSATEKTVGGVLIQARMGENSTTANYVSYDAMKFYIDPSIKVNLADTTVTLDKDRYVYSGEAVEPVVTVIVLGSVLDEGTDYVVEYANNDAPGEATFTIKPGSNGIFEGEYTGTFTIEEGEEYSLAYSYDDDALTASVTGLTYYGGAETFDVVIPSTVENNGVTYTVTAIADKAFKVDTNTADYAKISTVTIPSTVETIGASAFSTKYYYDTRALSAVVFDDIANSQLKTIGMNAFYGCNELTEFTFPASVETIGKNAFYLSWPTTTKPNYPENKLTKLTFLTKDAAMPSSIATTGTFYNVGAGGAVEVYAFESAAAVKTLIANNAGTTAGANKGMNFTYAGEPDEPVAALVATASTEPVALGAKGALTCSVEGLGSATASYQWQYRTSDTGDWKNATATGNTTAELTATVTASRAKNQYRCCVTASDGRTATTDPIMFDVSVEELTATASTEPVALGAKGALTCAVEGLGTATAAYQWQYSANGGTTWKTATATGNTTATLTATVTAARAGNLYRCCVTASDGRTATTDAIAFDVIADELAATASTTPVSLGQTGALTCTVEGAGEATLTYQWMYSTNQGSTWKKATATGNATDTLTAAVTQARASYVYKCCVTASDGRTAETEAIAFDTSGEQLAATASTLPAALNETGKLVCAVDGLGDATASYVWQYRTSSTGAWRQATATGYNTNTLTAKVTSTRAANEYRCVVTTSDGRTATTDPIQFDVVDALTATATTAPVALGATGKLTCSVAGAGTSTVSYQWQYRTSSTGAWKAATATGSQTPELSAAVTAYRATLEYRCVIATDDGRTAASEPIMFDVK